MEPDKPAPRFNPFVINRSDRITLLVIYQSLHMAARHQTYLAPAPLVRARAKEWLDKVNEPTNPRMRWNTLLNLFCDYYRDLLPIDADNNPLPVDKE